MSALRVAIAGGGTAGHAYPAVAVAEVLAHAGSEVRFIGTPTGPEARLAAQRGFPFEPIDVAGLQRSLTLSNVVAAALLVRATWRSLVLLGRIDPDVVVGTGGYVSLPVALAAAIHRIPLVLHEQNSVPGLANRIAGRFAHSVAVSFPGTEPRFGTRARLTGNPIRPEIASLDKDAARGGAIEHFGLAPGRRTLLVFGGSQGARRVNEAAVGAYNRWRSDERLQVLHLAGARGILEVERRLADLRGIDDRVVWRVLEFTDRMDLAYAAADLLVCRAGASSIAEIAAVGLPAILVPYPHAAEDHQRHNAEAVARTGGAEVVLDAEFTTPTMVERVETLLFDDARRARMAAAMRRFAVPDASERLAGLVVESAGRGGREAGEVRAQNSGNIDEPPDSMNPAPEPEAATSTKPATPTSEPLAAGGGTLGELDPEWRRVHLVGIGGSGVSAIARVLHDAGATVTGSDLSDSSTLRRLRALGIRVDIGHDPAHLDEASLVIASAAVPDDNRELAAARAAGIPVMPRGEALARIVAGRRVVAVSGTHGKSTTSGMIATVAETAGLEPTWLIGAALGDHDTGGRLGSGSVAVVEADEAYGSFLWLRPDIAVVTNVDFDHLDHYGTMAALEEAFRRFVTASSRAVLCLDDERAATLAGLAQETTTYGFDPQADVRAEDVELGAAGSRFTLVSGAGSAPVTLAVAGRHNVQNALGVAAASIALGLDLPSIAEGLGMFRGVSRRFQHRGTVSGADLVDDYAHHPREIQATLEAARWGPWERIVAVFQPHLYSRTQALFREFGSALVAADLVVVTDVYGAREDPVPGVTGKLVVEAACEAAPGRRVAYLPRLDEAAGFVRAQLRAGDLVLSLGAGDITSLADRVLSGA